MNKYDPLWEYVASQAQGKLTLTFAAIEEITGFPIDHSFLTYKKELLRYGFRAEKISMKNETVLFTKQEE